MGNDRIDSNADADFHEILDLLGSGSPARSTGAPARSSSLASMPGLTHRARRDEGSSRPPLHKTTSLPNMSTAAWNYNPDAEPAIVKNPVTGTHEWVDVHDIRNPDFVGVPPQQVQRRASLPTLAAERAAAEARVARFGSFASRLRALVSRGGLFGKSDPPDANQKQDQAKPVETQADDRAPVEMP